MTHEKYLTEKARLDDMNRQIDEAPAHAKPVFRGIAALHDRVMRYERKMRAAPQRSCHGNAGAMK